MVFGWQLELINPNKEKNNVTSSSRIIIKKLEMVYKRHVDDALGAYILFQVQDDNDKAKDDEMVYEMNHMNCGYDIK